VGAAVLKSVSRLVVNVTANCSSSKRSLRRYKIFFKVVAETPSFFNNNQPTVQGVVFWFSRIIQVAGY